MSFDTEGLKGRVDIVAVISAYTPLKKIGVEYCGPCPIHGGDGDNFFVNPKKGIWACFSHSCHEREEGNDVIGFIRIVENLDFKRACEFLGGRDYWQPVAHVVRKAPPPERVTSKPPAGSQRPNMAVKALGGEPSRYWTYRDEAGDVLGFVARYDTPSGKEIRCWTWGAKDGEATGWGMGHWNKPRPLYGLDRLAGRLGAPVLIVEGEKAADAAQELLGQMVVVTWPGGAQAWKHCDLSPLAGRTVTLWPDNDIPGIKCMSALAQELSDPRGLACTVSVIDPTGMPEGFDAADWNQPSGELVKWAKPRKKEYVHAELKKHGHGYSGDDQVSGPFPPVEAYCDESERVAHAAAPRKPRNGSAVINDVVYRRMSEVTAKPIDWLWPGRFAKGKVSMIVGNPGLGKSQLCASIVSVVSNGGSWPVDRSICKQGSVVILSAEDDPEDTIRPRLEAAGADLDRVIILEAIRVEREEGEGKRGFDLSTDIARLGALLYELGDASLVIIDPITAYLGDADSHKNAEVRALLAPLSAMAAAQGVAIISVSHLTKSAGMDALLRVQGSIGFAAAARAVWGVAKDKDNAQRRLFMPLKNNLGTDISGFAYSVEGMRLPESDIDTSRILWENELITQSADEVFGAQEGRDEEGGKVKDAKMFLQSLLSDGPMLRNDVKRDSEGADYAWRTIIRAKEELKVVAFKDGFKSPWKWRLP